MEAMTAIAVEEAAETAKAAAQTAVPIKMFRYSQFVHVGEGAEHCPVATWLKDREGEQPACGEVGHFHAWCRLPNQFQHQDIREKGLAAKARLVRMLRDPDSDASVALESELAQINDSVFADIIIDELLLRDFGEDLLEAQRGVQAREEFERYEQDREEWQRQLKTEGDLPEDEQSDEFRHLSKLMQRYLDAQREELDKLQEPRREELKSRPFESLFQLARDRRIEDQGNRAFMEAYNAWTWFVGTYGVRIHPTLQRPFEPAWAEIGRRDRPESGSMFAEAPEVIDAIRAVFGELNIALQRASAGN